MKGLVNTLRQLCSEAKLDSESIPGLRGEAVTSWAHRNAILLAAPESGLSATAATVLLSQWLPENPVDEIEFRKKARAAEDARHARAVAVAGGAARARQLLSDIDGFYPGHPWKRVANAAEEVASSSNKPRSK